METAIEYTHVCDTIMYTRFDLIPGYAVLMETDTYPIAKGSADGWFIIHDKQDVEIGRWYFRVVDKFGPDKIRFVNLSALFEHLAKLLKPHMIHGTVLKHCKIKCELNPLMPMSPDKVTSFLF